MAMPSSFKTRTWRWTSTIRAKRGPKLPTVLFVAEVQRLRSAVEPPFQLMVKPRCPTP